MELETRAKGENSAKIIIIYCG